MGEGNKQTDPAPVTGLVLPGGGARGAYQAGVLRGIAELVRDDRNPFPVISGVSVGAINAAWLARYGTSYRKAANKLAVLWSHLHADHVYRTDVAAMLRAAGHWALALTTGGLGLGNPRSLLDNAPLRQLLERELDFSGIGDAIKAGELRAIGITASSYATGRAVTFFQDNGQNPEWRRARRDGIRAELNGAHLLASAALPFIFPAQAVGEEYFADGSLRLTAPLSPPIRLGAEKLLVIGLREDEIDALPGPGEAQYPSLGEIGGYVLDVVFMDKLDDDIERLCRINRTVSLLSPEEKGNTRLKKIDLLTIEPSEDIREIARRHIAELPWTIRTLLHGVGGGKPDSRLPSYLLFEPGYCRALIALGLRDVRARRDEIRAFLET